MVFCIEKFLSYLCLVYSTNEGNLDLDYSSLDLPESKSVILRVMDRLHEIYQQEFQSVLESLSDVPEFHTNFKFYANAVLARCIKLFETRNYFHFMLVCTFMREIIFTSFDSEGCFTFAEIGLQCLLIMYDRFNERLLNATDGYRVLASYCRSLNPDLLLEEYDPDIPWPLSGRDGISLLIRSLNDVGEMNFPLADNEKERIDTCLNSIPSEDGGEVLEASTLNRSFEMKCSLNDETGLKDPVEFPNAANVVCAICRRECPELIQQFLDSIKI